MSDNIDGLEASAAELTKRHGLISIVFQSTEGRGGGVSGHSLLLVNLLRERVVGDLRRFVASVLPSTILSGTEVSESAMCTLLGTAVELVDGYVQM